MIENKASFYCFCDRNVREWHQDNWQQISITHEFTVKIANTVLSRIEGIINLEFTLNPWSISWIWFMIQYTIKLGMVFNCLLEISISTLLHFWRKNSLSVYWPKMDLATPSEKNTTTQNDPLTLKTKMLCYFGSLGMILDHYLMTIQRI